MVDEYINFDTCNFPIYGRYIDEEVVFFEKIKIEGWDTIQGTTVVSTPLQSRGNVLGYVNTGWNLSNATQIEPTIGMMEIAQGKFCNHKCNTCKRTYCLFNVKG